MGGFGGGLLPPCFHTARRGGALSGDSLSPNLSASQVLPLTPSPWGLGFILEFGEYTSVQSQAGMGVRLAGAKQGPECLIKEQGVLRTFESLWGAEKQTFQAEAQKRGLKSLSPTEGPWVGAEVR